MKTRSILLVSFILLAAMIFTACGGAAPRATEAPYRELAPAATQPPAPEALGAEMPAPQSADKLPAAIPTSAAYAISNAAGETTIIQNTNRKIIKNADIKLLVKDTDIAIDRTTQIVGDLGGYIISSRIWYQDYFGNNLKYATITIGIPVDQFERALTRLRELAIRVVDETASGEDVTDQYVDLESQLRNLEATRERVKSFLDQAKSVDEALRINQQLSDIENQIEQIRGRMNYLADRSSFSTITVNFEPEFPELTPTPTPTATLTRTPTPTSTPIPWRPGETFNGAKRSLTYTYQILFDFAIWIFVFVLPIVAPLALVLWGAWRFFRRRSKPSTGEKIEGS